jgi:uncharacterized protein YggE
MDESSVHLFESRRVRGSLLLVLVLLAVFLFAQSLIAFKQYTFVGQDIPAMHTIAVAGEGEVFVRPDIAVITFSVEAEAETTAAAEEQATERTNEVLAFVREQGIPDEDIRTLSYNLSPRYETEVLPRCLRAPCPTPQRTLVGYAVTQTIEVSAALAGEQEVALGELVSGLAERNVSNINGPMFEIDDEESHRDEARAAAITEAKEKAEQLAEDLDVTLVRLVNFHEGGNVGPMYTRSMAMDMAEGLGGGLDIAPEIPVGENQLVSRVELIYEIR